MQGRLVSPAECGSLFPGLNTAGLVGGVYCESDGSVDPTGLTLAYSKAAERAGATVLERCPVERVVVEGGKVVGLETSLGTVHTDQVI